MKIGGPAYRIGMGGGAASSRDQDTKNKNSDLNAVQRGDPEMENKLNKVLRTLMDLENNPIKSIHDQGAGGTGNVTKEIVYPKGGIVNLRNIIKGDSTMTALELWISEYQEQNTILIDPADLNILTNICQRENLPMSVIGKIVDTGDIKVFDGEHKVMDLPLEPIIGKEMPKKTYHLKELGKKYSLFEISDSLIS